MSELYKFEAERLQVFLGLFKNHTGPYLCKRLFNTWIKFLSRLRAYSSDITKDQREKAKGKVVSTLVHPRRYEHVHPKHAVSLTASP